MHVGEHLLKPEDCLPIELRELAPTITPIAAGMSGARVYRVEGGGRTYVLKVSSDDEPIDRWRHGTQIREQAAAAGVAPRVIHVDEARRAIVTEFVADRGFPMFYRDPSTHDAALAMLGQTL